KERPQTRQSAGSIFCLVRPRLISLDCIMLISALVRIATDQHISYIIALRHDFCVSSANMPADDYVPAPGHWPVDPQEDVPISDSRIWIDGCFDFAHHG